RAGARGCAAGVAGGARRLPGRPPARHPHRGKVDSAKGGAMTGGGISLGVNIDHVATLRQARRGRYPDPVHAALAAETAGADSITLHLREDRRHIQDHDVRTLRGLLHTGAYAQAAGAQAATELERLRAAARLGAGLGLEVHAGHGLNYHNVRPVAALREIVELNIGHALIAHALFVGLSAAVREMKAL